MTARKKQIPEVEKPLNEKRLTLIEQIEAKTSAFELREFAVMYGIAYPTAWDLAKSGRLPATKVGSSWRLDPATTAQWLRERTTA